MFSAFLMKGNEMRLLQVEEIKKRGCTYCIDVVPTFKQEPHFKRRKCPYDECPHHELDGYESYDKYLAANSQGDDFIARMMMESGENKNDL